MTYNLEADIKSTQFLHAEINVLPSESSGDFDYLIGEGLKVEKNEFGKKVLSVDTSNKVEKDNTKPITSAAVYTTVGNIESLLSTL